MCPTTPDDEVEERSESQSEERTLCSNLPILKLVHAIEKSVQSGFMIPKGISLGLGVEKKKVLALQEADKLEHLFTHNEGSDDTPVSRRTLHSVALARQPILSCRENATGRGA